MIEQNTKLKIGILGASGYTGAELIRLLVRHPFGRIDLLTGGRKAGEKMGSVFPHLSHLDLPILKSIEETDFAALDLDVVFCALPHATSQEIIKKLWGGRNTKLKIIDLSADFRLRDVETYAQWYGGKHIAPDLQKEAIYGLTEQYRDEIKTARLVACPGCYPTAALLTLIPLMKEHLIEKDGVIIDAKSGASGAGRSLREGNLFVEVSEAIHPYGIASHRHAPEIEQELSKAYGEDLMVSFTPHLIPMNRGELETIYVSLAEGKKASDLRAHLKETYKNDTFVHIAEEGDVPATRNVKGSNKAYISVHDDRVSGRAILIAVIDNLVKGSSGQAIQNMNIMFGFEETLSLEQAPLFP
jgi:N-acetyl-gamma-glutamyl-phosphate reductase